MKPVVVPLSVALALLLTADQVGSHEARTAVDQPAGWHRVHDWEDEDRSHDRARRATEAGEILPLAQIYERARREIPGRVLEAELEGSHGRWIYELKILDPGGRLYELHLDAASGRVLGREEKD
jgi:uncharacterized membrane protein YkoI